MCPSFITESVLGKRVVSKKRTSSLMLILSICKEYVRSTVDLLVQELVLPNIIGWRWAKRESDQAGLATLAWR